MNIRLLHAALGCIGYHLSFGEHDKHIGSRASADGQRLLHMSTLSADRLFVSMDAHWEAVQQQNLQAREQNTTRLLGQETIRNVKQAGFVPSGIDSRCRTLPSFCAASSFDSCNRGEH